MLLAPLLRSLWTVLRPVAKKAEECFKRWTKPVTLLEGAAADLLRTKPELIAENALLRQQLIVLERQVKHPTLTPLDRGLLVVLASRLPHWKRALLIVKPETLLKWHRRGFQLFWSSPLGLPRCVQEGHACLRPPFPLLRPPFAFRHPRRARDLGTAFWARGRKPERHFLSGPFG